MTKVAAAAVAALLVGCSPDQLPDDTLKVGMELSYPPFETIDASGTPSGISVELAKAIGTHLGRPVRIENIPFVGLIPALQSGKVDLVISSMTRTDEREQSIDFSEPYLRTGLALLVPKDSSIGSLADLDQDGRVVAVRQGTTGETFARSHFKEARVLTLEKESSAVLEVIQGKADAFIYDQMSVWKNANDHADKTRALLNPISEEAWAIGIRKGETELRDQVNSFLRKFRDSGGFDRLGDQYLGEQKKAFAEANVPFFF